MSTIRHTFLLLATSALAMFFTCALALVCAPVFGAAPGGGADGIAITVAQRSADGLTPVTYFKLAASPGRSRAAGRIVVANPTRRPVTVDVRPVSAVTASNLGFAYTVPRPKVSGAAGWTRVGRRTVTIGPGERRTVRVTVAPPSGAPAGDHLSGIAIEARGQGSSSARGTRVAVASTQRFVVGVMVTVPGAQRPEIALTGARLERRPGGTAFLIAARNSGNVLFTDVSGSVTISRGKRVVATSRIEPGTFVAGTSIEYPVPAPRERVREGAEYRVRAVMHYGERTARLDTIVSTGRKAAQADKEFTPAPARPETGTPWAIVLGIAGGGAALLGFALVSRRRRRQLRQAQDALARLAAQLEAIEVRPDAAEETVGVPR
jgi:LPXTG-motif cell wall-anchored protein